MAGLLMQCQGRNIQGRPLQEQVWEDPEGQARHRYGHGRLMQGKPGTGTGMGGSCRASQAQVRAWEAHAGQARYGMVKAASESVWRKM